MLRVLHTADTHIGYRQYHADERRHDFLTAFEAVIDDAIDSDVDAVVHAGDLFHDKRPDLRDLQGTIALLARLRGADIPFLGIVGNHERKRDTQWLDLFADLGLATRLGVDPFTIDGVAVYGLDYLTPSTRSPAAADFVPAQSAEVSLLVGHGIIKGLPYGDWDLDAVLEASNIDFDGVLLGDYHEHELERREGTVVTYPGSTERASADERAPRGYNLVTIEDGEVTVSHRTLTETRDFVYIDIELNDGEGEARVFERLDEYDLENAVAIVTVDGRGEAISPGAVETRAREAGAIVARVRDRRGEEGASAPDGEVTVTFADPDRAVRETLTDVDLSEAAHDLDSIIRDSSIPDSRVRERAREYIEGLLADDPEALDRPGELEEPDADDEQSPVSDEAEPTSPSEQDDVRQTDEPGEEVDDEGEEVVTTASGQASMEEYL